MPSLANLGLRSPRSRWTVAAAAIVVVGGGLGIYFGTRSTPSASASLLQTTTETVQVTTGTIKQSVAASGTIQPGQEENLDFAVSGQVNAVDVAAGQTVTKGQKLATIDPTVLADQLSAAQATLTAAQDKLSTDEAAGAPTSQIDSDESSVNSAESSLTTARTDRADATLTSPISGTVASVNLTVGEQVSASGATGSGSGGSGGGGSSGSAEITVIDTGSFTVSASVSDTQIGGIKVGDQAVITPSGSNSNVYGVVTSMGLIADTSSNVATFPVTIQVTGNPTGLYAGSSANVSIITEQLTDVTEVPTAAISYANGSATVTKVTGAGDKTVDITTGASAGGETQVTAGLQPGDKIVEHVVRINRSALTRGGSRNLFGSPGSPGGAGRSFTGGGGAFFGGGNGPVQIPAGGGGGGGFGG